MAKFGSMKEGGRDDRGSEPLYLSSIHVGRHVLMEKSATNSNGIFFFVISASFQPRFVVNRHPKLLSSHVRCTLVALSRL
jgi:hypothetical protein